ncbi:EGF-like repeat and discoidin I-like domain-containing protein 3 [Branchiostoma floridae]|uniref:EGF-like repeat and discoidin I-like domain-containing protein 3 n=1 Tax=Branchiostoma floridae TaxID=7739 RepID=A0A9J7MJY4_BRAFL|nr:EGF-like repeat and discoidin I-like domain-containing protein 3 [Branchiostoma floridae]
MESGAISDESITASGYYKHYPWDLNHAPYHARLNGRGGAGAWVGSGGPRWLQVDLGDIKHITGTISQGRHWNHAQWVTSYKLQYSTDATRWTIYSDSDGLDKVFRGNMDMRTPVTNMLCEPIEARYVRFLPQTWDGGQAMRVEILGCGTYTCRNPLGMESGAIPDERITASGFYKHYPWDNNHAAYRGRLNGRGGAGAWAGRGSAIWLQVDLGDIKHITGTVTQGRHWNHAQWVTSYKLQHSTDATRWTTYADSDGSDKVFPGNTDMRTPVTSMLCEPIEARYVRLLPQTFHGDTSMRVEILGCSKYG